MGQAPGGGAPCFCLPVHKVAGAIDGVDDPGRAVGEHTLGPRGCGFFCNEPAAEELRLRKRTENAE